MQEPLGSFELSKRSFVTIALYYKGLICVKHIMVIERSATSVIDPKARACAPTSKA
ncbi:MAG: hypothetical protein RBR54_04870 [Sulfurimonas sp.]|nr:hypothetical protein [Sulfurimonas sp.]